MAALPTSPSVGDPGTAAWAGVVAADASIIDRGTVAITPSAINTTTSSAVVFNKTFPSAPAVMLYLITATGSTVTVNLWSSVITTAGFTANIQATSTTARTLGWIAVLPA